MTLLCISQEHVRPYKSGIELRTPIRGIDLQFSFVTVPILFVFKDPLNRLTFDRLKDAFLHVLEKIPVLAGELRRIQHTWMIDVHDSKGCLLEYWWTDAEMPTETSSDDAWKPYSTPHRSHLSFTSNPTLFTARLTQFKTGWAIHVSFSHTLMDSNGIYRVMKVWANELFRDTENPPPFSPDFNSNRRPTTYTLFSISYT
jgi:hypothetical protein